MGTSNLCGHWRAMPTVRPLLDQRGAARLPIRLFKANRMNTVEIAARHLPASEPSQQPETPPLDMRRIDRHLVSLVTRDSFEAEQYRRLRYVLENIRRDATGLVVVVCSSVTGDGKSVTAMNLAGALAQDEAVKAL